jgi:hypothetical protein
VPPRWPAKNNKERLLLGLVPRLGAWTLRAFGLTWRIREAGRTQHSPFGKPAKAKIYVVWHESALAASFYRGQSLHALASKSFDGELISRALLRLGWKDAARGSSSRGASSGLMELHGFLNQGDPVLLTVDGPRGPRRIAKDGAIKLAVLSGHSVVPVAFCSRPDLRLKTWDRMNVPPPFARGVFWFGEELSFSADSGRSSGALRELQTALDRATQDAERFMAER